MNVNAESRAGGGNRREQVLQHLRAEIVSGRVAPGTLYSVPALSSELKMSTTPVREALLELARVGLVTPLRNRGFRVEAMSLNELDNLFDMRVLLETQALVLVARRGLRDTAPLVKLADDVRDAVKAEDVRGYLETDRKFHHALVERAGNPLLTRMVMGLRDDMRLYGIDSPAGRKRQRESVDEHYQMIQLGEEGNEQAITPLIALHIESWKPLFAKAFATENNAEAVSSL